MAQSTGRETSALQDKLVPGRILVAEDEFLIAMMLDDYLSEVGFDVTITHDGVEALEAATVEHFDVLVTDMRMPRLDGAALIERVRVLHPSMPVVMLTSHAPPNWRALSATAPTVLMEKPLAMPALAAQLRRMIGTARRQLQ